MKIERYLSTIACVWALSGTGCDNEALARAQEDSGPMEPGTARNDEEFRRALLASKPGGELNATPRKTLRKRRGQALPQKQCVYSGLGNHYSKGMVRIQPFGPAMDGLQIYKGERVSLKITNLGDSHFEGGLISARFRLSEAQAEAYVNDGDLRRSGFGWGRFRNSPEEEPGYSGALFVRLDGGKSVVRTPEVATSCDRRFPYNAILSYLEMSWNTICRQGTRDGIFSVKIWAQRASGAKRMLSEFSFDACKGEVSSSGFQNQLQIGPSPSTMQYAIDTPPRGPAYHDAGDATVVIY